MKKSVTIGESRFNSTQIGNYFGRESTLSKWPGILMHFRFTEFLVVSQIIYFSWKWGAYLPKLTSIQDPVGLANYIDLTFLLHSTNALINAALITFLCILGLFRVFRSSYAIALLFMHLQYAARFSAGKVGHGSVLPGLMFFSLTLAIIFFTDELQRAKVGIFLMLFFAGLAYDSAALCKLIASGLAWVQGDHLWLWMQENLVDQLSANGTVHLNYLQNLVMNNSSLATGILSVGIITESSGLFLLNRQMRPFVATALIGMHIGVYLILKIDFSSYILILLLLGFPWDRWLIKALKLFQRGGTITRVRTI